MKSGILALVACAITLPAWSADAPAAGAAAEPTAGRDRRQLPQRPGGQVGGRDGQVPDSDGRSGDEVLAAVRDVSEGAARHRRGPTAGDAAVRRAARDLTDAQALDYVNALLARDQKIHDLRVKWLARFQTVVPPATAARAIQVERRLGLVTQIGLSSQIPLVRAEH